MTWTRRFLESFGGGLEEGRRVLFNEDGQFIIRLTSGGTPEPPDPSATLWVNSSTGDDSRSKATVAASGGSLPWATIGRAAWGSTTRSSPNSSEAAAAGDVVSIAAGTYSFSGVVSSREDPVYNPVNEGTAANPIVFMATGGTVVLAAPNAQSPVIGSDARDYIEWFADVTIGCGWSILADPNGTSPNPNRVYVTIDTGPCVLWNCTGSLIEGATITGITATYTDNYNGIRWENAVDCIARNNTITGFHNASDSINGSATTLYGSINCIFEHNAISDCGTGVMNKDAPAAPTGNSNHIRYNTIDNMGHGLGFSMTGQSASYYYQNIITNCRHGFLTTGGGQNNFWIYNNTFIDCIEDGFYLSSGGGTGSKFWNNIFDNQPICIVCAGSAMPADSVADSEHNCYHTYTNFYAGTDGTRTFANFKATFTDQDQAAVASIDADPLFVNRAAGNYRLQAGSPARNIGTDPFSLSTVNAGAYITGSETIGVE